MRRDFGSLDLRNWISGNTAEILDLKVRPFRILDSGAILDLDNAAAGFQPRMFNLGFHLAELDCLILDFGFSGSSGREQG